MIPTEPIGSLPRPPALLDAIEKTQAEDRTRALRAGFLVHIAKPVDPAELVATVVSVAGRVRESG